MIATAVQLSHLVSLCQIGPGDASSVAADLVASRGTARPNGDRGELTRKMALELPGVRGVDEGATECKCA